MERIKQKIIVFLIAILSVGVIVPTPCVMASAKDSNKSSISSYGISEETKNDSESEHSGNTVTLAVPNNTSTLPETAYTESKLAPAIASIYLMPGFGEVAVTVTGAVIVAGVTYGVGSSIYNLVKRAIKNGTAKKKSNSSSALDRIKKKIPSRLKKKDGKVNLDLFVNKEGSRKGNNRYYKKYRISKDRDNHKGSMWKLFDGKERIASLAGDGRIVGK